MANGKKKENQESEVVEQGPQDVLSCLQVIANKLTVLADVAVEAKEQAPKK